MSNGLRYLHPVKFFCASEDLHRETKYDNDYFYVRFLKINKS